MVSGGFEKFSTTPRICNFSWPLNRTRRGSRNQKGISLMTIQVSTLRLYQLACCAVCVICLNIASAVAAETVLTFTGTVEPNEIVDVCTSVSGKIISFGAESG